MPTAAIGAAVGIGGSLLSARSQRKAADKAAQGVENAQQISKDAAQQARRDVLGQYNQAFVDISQGFEQSQADLLAGRTRVNDILRQSTQQVGNLLLTGAEQRQAALMGTPQQRSLFGGPAAQPAPAAPAPAQAAPAAPQKDLTPAPMKPEPRSALESAVMGGAGGQLGEARTTLQATPEPPPQQMAPPPQMAPTQEPIKGQVAQRPFGGLDRMNARQQGRFTPDIPQGSFGPSQGLPPHLTNVARQQGRFPAFGQQRPATPTPAPTPITATEIPELATGPITQGMDVGGLPQGEYGLGGMESALLQGVQARESALRAGFDQGRSDLQGGAQRHLSELRQGITTARGDITTGRDAATGRFDPYAQTGEQALQREAALSGALGPEAQQQAMDQFIESPGQKFARERAEKALMRTAGARGGLGGGQLMTELQEQAIGIAAQQQQQQLANLQNLAMRGQQAAGAQAGYDFGAGQALGDVAFRGGQATGNVQGALGQNLAQLAAQQGLSLSGVYGDAANRIGGARLGVGERLAADTAADRLAQLESAYGQNVIGQEAAFNENLANLAMTQGQLTANQRQNLAGTLANIGTGAGTQQSQLAQNLGSVRAQGVTNPLGNALSQLGGLTMGGAFGNFMGGGTSTLPQNAISPNQFISNVTTGPYAGNFAFPT